ncbi:hypothetical protein L4C33_21955 [Vibrio makurazakiensis]|uniref:hypothetical protein n=1 Tax=Vibrio makurazakiensis TaxID=2910250 RepID=UPI003D0FD385
MPQTALSHFEQDLYIELEHIFLEAKFERWKHIERFLFPYFCYRTGYVTKQGKPDWEFARQSVPKSTSTNDPKELVMIPLVPESSVIGEIKCIVRDDELSKEALSDVLDKLLTYCLITKTELAKMKKLGVEKSMPAAWYQLAAKEPLDRLEFVGITLDHSPL